VPHAIACDRLACVEKVDGLIGAWSRRSPIADRRPTTHTAP
jgi:hypothetical protein